MVPHKGTIHSSIEGASVIERPVLGLGKRNRCGLVSEMSARLKSGDRSNLDLIKMVA